MKRRSNFDKLENFAHNYIRILIKCPECVRIIKGMNHVKNQKNLAALLWHIRTEHKTISNTQFNMAEIIEILKAISKALNLGLSGSEIAKICKASHLGMLDFN